MRRREFITLFGSAAAARPLSVHAQQGRRPVIGFLHSESPDIVADRLRAFRQGLSEAGFAEGQNVTIEYRWAQGQYDRLPALASDLVARQVSVIFANGPAAIPAKAATTTIPIVFYSGADPVALGLVASLNRPGGNVTGIANLSVELGPKRLELLHELAPTVRVIGWLTNPSLPPTQSSSMQAAARNLKLTLNVLNASNGTEIDSLFAAIPQLGVGALVIEPDPIFTSRMAQLAAQALRQGTPAIYSSREFADAGGLLSYGARRADADQFRLVGVYIGRILEGERPADLPVQEATGIELVVNLKTAKALGLMVPQSILLRADVVIE
jgi:putative ABC transport system substrate-binding protein